MEPILQFWSDYIVPRLHVAKSNRRSITTATAAFAIAYYLFQKLNRPPRKLRHIPHISGFTTLYYTIRRIPIDDVFHNFTLPVSQQTESGLYSRITPTGWQIVINDPAIAKQYLFDSKTFPKVPINDTFSGTVLGRFIIGPNILFLSGQHWKDQRKIANPAFHRSMPVALFGRLTTALFKEMDKTSGESVDAYDLMERWTLDVIGNASFGFDFGAVSEEGNAWVRRYNELVENSLHPLFAFLPILEKKYLHWFPKRKRIHDEITIFLDMMQTIIDEKRKAIAEGKVDTRAEKDLLTMMMENDEDGKGLTDEELKSNLCVFFFAGHDTTASALCFAIYYMAMHPEVQERAREEAVRVLGNDPEDIAPTVEQMQQMTYINMVIKEVLRISGPADALISRVATKDTELGGVFVPKGTLVSVSITELHRNPKVWENPDTFDPERFATGKGADEAMAWIPFSSGSRQCIGMNFSLTEQRFFLPMLRNAQVQMVIT
ncbi:cytochrome P450 [Fennellomyces sp. T-0311]|nr:cytochrome P450 [Fennellomyces sp. T-0311]